jgi:hypothetical protein
LPLSFEPNVGQADAEAKFLVRGQRASVFITSRGALFARRRDASVQTNGGAAPGPEDGSAPLRMEFLGASGSARPVALQPLPGKANYVIGNDPSSWRTGIPTYRKVMVAGLYPGVDLVYYGNQRQLEYDFVVAPGADPGLIRLSFPGVEAIQVDRDGDLILTVAGQNVIQRRPHVFQRVDGARRVVSGGYVISAKDQVNIQVGSYDHDRALVIDPVLVYSTYLGGGADDGGTAVAVDPRGNAYVVGGTSSIDFPTVNPIQAANGGDAFVVKIDPSGTNLLYSTYIGGSSGDGAIDIAVDPKGNAYVAGVTSSTDFPTASPLQAANGGIVDMFVSKIDPSGRLVYSTYLGGNGEDNGRGIAVDFRGNAYVTGFTLSTDFPTANALQTESRGFDAFVAKIGASGTTLLYSTYLGGSGDESATGIAVDPRGNAYVTGSTDSTDFPIANPLQAAMSGIADVFITKIDPAGTTLVYSTYLGGSDNDIAYDIAVDPRCNAYVAGQTGSTNFPTMSSIQSENGGAGDAFVTKIDPAGTTLVYSTYLGGSDSDAALGIALNRRGNAYVTGFTSSTDFPTASPLQAAKSRFADAFVAELDSSGTTLVYSTYLGGSDWEGGTDIAADARGNALVTGETRSADFPTANPLQAANRGTYDAFVARISRARPLVAP